MGLTGKQRWEKGLASIPSGLVTTGGVLAVLSVINGDPLWATVVGIAIVVPGGLLLFYGVRWMVRRRRRKSGGNE